MEFRGYQNTYATTLPPVNDTPLFQHHDSLYRLLLKATAPKPDDRFQTADELREQLLGVLREVVAVDSGRPAAPHSSPSDLFGSPTASGAALSWTDLPALRVDRSDPSAAWLAGVSLGAGEQLLRVLEQAPQQTVEVQLAKARAAVDAKEFPIADQLIEDILADNPWEWRAIWISGLAALARKAADTAQTAFNTVLGQVPGELAPKLALAVACEACGADEVAEYLYAVCAATDANYVAPAAFGLSRARARATTSVAVSARSISCRRRAARTWPRDGAAPSFSRAPVAASTTSPPRPRASTRSRSILTTGLRP